MSCGARFLCCFWVLQNLLTGVQNLCKVQNYYLRSYRTKFNIVIKIDPDILVKFLMKWELCFKTYLENKNTSNSKWLCFSIAEALFLRKFITPSYVQQNVKNSGIDLFWLMHWSFTLSIFFLLHCESLLPTFSSDLLFKYRFFLVYRINYSFICETLLLIHWVKPEFSIFTN